MKQRFMKFWNKISWKKLSEESEKSGSLFCVNNAIFLLKTRIYAYAFLHFLVKLITDKKVRLSII